MTTTVSPFVVPSTESTNVINVINNNGGSSPGPPSVGARPTNIPVLSRLSGVFRDIILVSQAVVITVGLLIFLVSSVDYGQLMIIEQERNEDVAANYAPTEKVLYYNYSWWVIIWIILFPSVRSCLIIFFFSFLISILFTVILMLIYSLTAYMQHVVLAIGVFLFAGHVVRNMDGAPSLRKRVIATVVHWMIVTTNWTLNYINAFALGTLYWDCKSPLLSTLDSCWKLFNAFGLGVALPTLISYIMTRNLKDKVAALNWRYLSILLLIGSIYFYAMAAAPNIVVIFLNLRSDTNKILMRLLLIPLMNYVGFAAVHWASNKLELDDPSDSVYLTMMFLLISCFYSRFLQNSLSTYSATIICSVAVGLQELIMRLTLKARGKVFAKYILGKSDAELAAIEGDEGGEVVMRQARKEATARLILVEMIIEYVAIPLTPLLTVLNQKNSIHVHLGYDIYGDFDSNLLLFSSLSSLVMELLVDAICFNVQDRWFKLRETWSHLIASSKLWTRMFPNLLIGTMFAVLLMLYGFIRSQIFFASDKCAMHSNCLPYPCMCYSPANHTVNRVNPLTGSNVSLSLPPLFDSLCSSIYSINSNYIGNGTTGAMTYEQLQRVYSMVLSIRSP
jgi:hypothetical protein